VQCIFDGLSLTRECNGMSTIGMQRQTQATRLQRGCSLVVVLTHFSGPPPHFPTPSPRAHAHACTQDSRERAALEQQLREAREAAEAREVEWENWLDEKLAEERSRLQTEFEGERARTRDEVRLSGLGLRA
jgi:hypothetical protein